MFRIAPALVLSLAPLVAACGTASEASPAKPASTEAASTADFQTACMTVMQRNRTCTEEFIPALVDMRARKDLPPGIAEEVKKDRAGVIAHAMEEWATDSTDEAFARQCQSLATRVSQDDAEAGRACMAKDTCAAYVPCIIDLMDKSMHK